MLKVRIGADAVLIGVALVLVPVFVRAYAPPSAPFVAQDGKSTTRYDATASTDPRGRVRQYAHDPLGRRTAAIKPSGATDRFGYDGLGNWATFTNAEGRHNEAMSGGKQIAAPNKVNPGNTATRYVHPETGRSVVVDDVTSEVLHVGGDGFKY